MTAPGWYPDPGGRDAQRYFDGSKWTDQLAPQRRPSKSLRPFVIMAAAGPVTAIVAFVVMQLAFSAAAGGGSGAVLLNVVGFVMFLVWLASVAVTIVGLVGVVVRAVRRSGG